MKRFSLICALALALSPPLASLGASEAPRPFVAGSWDDIARASAGQPTIVHFWGLTCPICVVELTDWGKFAAAHPGLRIVLINWDRRLDDPSRIPAVLDKYGLGGAESWTLGNGFEEKLRFAIDRDWMGELPRSHLISRDGTIETFSGKADFKKLADWVASESLLQAQGR